MLVRLKSQLEMMEEGHENKNGTMIAIETPFDFTKTNGYIQFIKLAVGNLPKTYGKQIKEWQKSLNTICDMVEKLQDKNVRFTGSDKDAFKKYCQRISSIMDSKTKEHLPVVKLDTETSEDLTGFISRHIEEGHILGFYYGKDEDVKKALMDDLSDQLGRLKFEKNEKNIEVSDFLRRTGYHEHVHDALNTLLDTATYAVNCRSSKGGSLLYYDEYEISRGLSQAKSLMRRMSVLI